MSGSAKDCGGRRRGKEAELLDLPGESPLFTSSEENNLE